MKSAIHLITGILMCSLWAVTTDAQCQFSYSPNYGVYTSESTDGTNLYASVLTDGNSSMSVVGGCPDGVRNAMIQAINSASHTPNSYNVLGGVGGWNSGSSGCVSCYISYQNNQSIASATPGTEYEFDWSGQVSCSAGGTIFASSGSGFISLHRTVYKYASIANNVCTYTVFCPNSTHVCGPDAVTVEAPCAETYFITSWFKFRKGVNSTCFPGPTGILSNQSAECK